MATKLPLTLTCGDYEITRPLAEGLVEPDGIALTVLTNSASRDRHWRLARNAECDLGARKLVANRLRKVNGHSVGPKFLSYHNSRIYRKLKK